MGISLFMAIKNYNYMVNTMENNDYCLIGLWMFMASKILLDYRVKPP